MKKGRLLNQPISSLIAGMGHTDQLVIADAGLPIPDGPERIDLALERGTPGFIQTLEAIMYEMAVEEVILAEEIKTQNKEVYEEVLRVIKNTPRRFVSHEQFKQLNQDCKAIVRTGESTPYANIILQSGVAF